MPRKKEREEGGGGEEDNEEERGRRAKGGSLWQHVSEAAMNIPFCQWTHDLGVLHNKSWIDTVNFNIISNQLVNKNNEQLLLSFLTLSSSLPEVRGWEQSTLFLTQRSSRNWRNSSVWKVSALGNVTLSCFSNSGIILWVTEKMKVN